MLPTLPVGFWFFRSSSAALCLAAAVLVFGCKRDAPDRGVGAGAGAGTGVGVGVGVGVGAGVGAGTDAGVGAGAGTDAAEAVRFGDGDPSDLVDIVDYNAGIVLDMRYATANNFAKRAVYSVARCRLRRDVAERVVRAHRALANDGVGLKIWDCYRPFSVQEAFWKLVPDGRYVAKPVRKAGKPVRGSKHNRGAAIDVTLVDNAGRDLAMPTDHDDFSPAAHRSNAGWSAASTINVERLTRALKREGFTTIASEWWHFDGPDWKRYPLADEPL